MRKSKAKLGQRLDVFVQPAMVYSRFKLLILVCVLAGCAQHRSIPAISPPSGESETRLIQDLKISCAIPDDWRAAPLRKTSLYSHQQWHSPSDQTGLGVAHLSMPLPLPANWIVWFAKSEYVKRSHDPKAKFLARWKDYLGREWFEAENSYFHVHGYAITRGCDAWIIYRGWRQGAEPDDDELALSRRTFQSVAPDPQ